MSIEYPGGEAIRKRAHAQYALTATSPDGLTAVVPRLVVTDDVVPLATLTLRTVETGVRLQGTVLHDSATGKRVEVRAFRDGELPGEEYVTSTDDSGRFSLVVPRGDYTIGAARAGFEIDFARVTPDGSPIVLHLGPSTAPPPAAVVEWLQRHAIAIARPDPGHGVDDLAAFESIVGDARVVALGEATHGTREFFQLKHRLFELLATRKGFDVFAIEATMPESEDVNRYVLTGEGDPVKALAGLYFWTWNTEEVLDLIRWMRSFNADPAHTRKLRFCGFDMQAPMRSAKTLSAFLRKVEPAYEATVRSLLRDLATPEHDEVAPSEGEAMRDRLDLLLARFDTSRSAWERRTSAKDHALARQAATLLRQFADRAARPGPAARDEAMAANVRFLLEQEGPTSKMVVWAHNGHVATSPMGGEVTSMGQWLRRSLGPSLVTVGFAFDRGSFQAIERPVGLTPTPREFIVPSLPTGTLGTSLALAGAPLALFDLHAVPSTGEVHDWFAAPHTARSVGALFGLPEDKRVLSTERVLDSFDALVFVADTTAARPVGGRTTPTLPGAPRNLDFEAPGEGVPVGWSAGKSETWGYTVKTIETHGAQGKRSLGIRRRPGVHYGELSAVVAQSIDAAPFIGTHVTVSARLKASPEGEGSAALLRIKRRPSAEKWTTASITSREWSRASVTVEVTPEVKTLTFAVELIGDGSLDADDFVIEAR